MQTIMFNEFIKSIECQMITKYCH